jgi:hypothetical protein
MAKKVHFFGWISPIKTPLESISRKFKVIVRNRYTGWCIGLREHSIVELSLVEVTLETSMTLEEGVKQDRQVFVVLKHVFRYLKPHRGCETLQKLFEF